jgi:hypothetical protein
VSGGCELRLRFNSRERREIPQNDHRPIERNKFSSDQLNRVVGDVRFRNLDTALTQAVLAYPRQINPRSRTVRGNTALSCCRCGRM